MLVGNQNGFGEILLLVNVFKVKKMYLKDSTQSGERTLREN